MKHSEQFKQIMDIPKLRFIHIQLAVAMYPRSYVIAPEILVKSASDRAEQCIERWDIPEEQINRDPDLLLEISEYIYSRATVMGDF